MDNLNFGEKLRKLRKSADKSAEEAGRVTGVKSGAVYAWENGTSTPDAIQLLNLCTLYNATFEDLDEESIETTSKKKRPWDASINIKHYASRIAKEHPKGYTIQVRDTFADAVLPKNSYAFIEATDMAADDALCAVSIDGKYPIFGKIVHLAHGLRIKPVSTDPTYKDVIVDTDDGYKAEIIGEVIWHLPPYAEF